MLRERRSRPGIGFLQPHPVPAVRDLPLSCPGRRQVLDGLLARTSSASSGRPTRTTSPGLPAQRAGHPPGAWSTCLASQRFGSPEFHPRRRSAPPSVSIDSEADRRHGPPEEVQERARRSGWELATRRSCCSASTGWTHQGHPAPAEGVGELFAEGRLSFAGSCPGAGRTPSRDGSTVPRRCAMTWS